MECRKHGEEATNDGALKFPMEKYNNKYVCYQSTKYNGHHHMVCSLYHRDNTLMARDKFGIYVSDNRRPFKNLTGSKLVELK